MTDVIIWETTTLAAKTLVADPQNPSYEAGTDWVGGVAPVAGDTVTLQTLYQGGPSAGHRDWRGVRRPADHADARRRHIGRT